MKRACLTLYTIYSTHTVVFWVLHFQIPPKKNAGMINYLENIGETVERMKNASTEENKTWVAPETLSWEKRDTTRCSPEDLKQDRHSAQYERNDQRLSILSSLLKQNKTIHRTSLSRGSLHQTEDLVRWTKSPLTQRSWDIICNTILSFQTSSENESFRIKVCVSV